MLPVSHSDSCLTPNLKFNSSQAIIQMTTLFDSTTAFTHVDVQLGININTFRPSRFINSTNLSSNRYLIRKKNKKNKKKKTLLRFCKASVSITENTLFESAGAKTHPCLMPFLSFYAYLHIPSQAFSDQCLRRGVETARELSIILNTCLPAIMILQRR